jgi:hypothetical protein
MITPERLGEHYLGRMYPLDIWTGDLKNNPLGKDYIPLTVNATGNPYFADYQPHNFGAFLLSTIFCRSLESPVTIQTRHMGRSARSNAAVRGRVNNINSPRLPQRGEPGPADHRPNVDSYATHNEPLKTFSWG